jgi:hypothetical protein
VSIRPRKAVGGNKPSAAAGDLQRAVRRGGRPRQAIQWLRILWARFGATTAASASSYDPIPTTACSSATTSRCRIAYDNRSHPVVRLCLFIGSGYEW